MSARADRPSPFTARPRDPEAWVSAPEVPVSSGSAKTDGFTARLTVDVTPGLRGRIKVTAFTRGLTVANMLRAMLAEAFPEHDGDSR